ncbi:hypothetical protein GCM10010389_49910 [Streptomyces echinoruber]|uniref:Uncharacterized protein n=1 Tax=Streptomyces echinoruber TaxID=68898 RepID=A0A918VKW9_9ACTN|nr:hypothetical protein GCM10010389_49910 [Streptomyces echinoruber]
MRKRERFRGRNGDDSLLAVGAGERAKKIDRTIALFEKKHPKMYPKTKVKTDFQDHRSFWEKFRTQAAGGNPPDVFRNAVGFLRKCDRRGVLLDLKSPAQAGNPNLKNSREGVLRVGRVDGEQLGVPIGSPTMTLVVDRKVLRKAGVAPGRAGPGTSTARPFSPRADSASAGPT